MFLDTLLDVLSLLNIASNGKTESVVLNLRIFATQQCLVFMVVLLLC